MKLSRVALHYINDGLLKRTRQMQILRNLSTSITPVSGTNDSQNPNSVESADEFEKRIFGANSTSNLFYQKLEKLERNCDRTSGSFLKGMMKPDSMDGLDDSFNTLSDGMDGKLKKVANYFEYDPEEIKQDDYAFRPDMTFKQPMTYDTKDLDLRKPGVRKAFKRTEFEVTTEEVLRKADFRNVRFLANFITDAGIIIKRSQTKISAKAQRKVAREIKTARAFGLMPFTTMGTKSFIFGKTMESLNEDFEYETYDSNNPNPENNRGPMRQRFS